MKKLIKRLSLWIGYLVTLPLIIITWIEGWILGQFPSPLYGCCKEILSLIPTPIGEVLRLAYYRAVCKCVSTDISFMLGSMLARRDILIGHNTVIGAYTIIGFARIGENVIIGARVSIISGKYMHGKPGERSGVDDEEIYQTINIGSNTWIGQDSVIIANVGKNCVVSAGSVVLKDVPDNTTVMGNPARKVNLG